MRAIESFEDGTVVSVGDNWAPETGHDPLGESIVYLELSDERSTTTAGLTRDEAVDLIDGILAVLESYGVAPSA